MKMSKILLFSDGISSKYIHTQGDTNMKCCNYLEEEISEKYVYCSKLFVKNAD